MKHLIIPALALALSGCVTPQPTTPAPKNVVDKVTSTGAKALKQACLGINVLIDVMQLYVEKPAVVWALSKAEAVAESYCNGPTPADVPGALLAIATAYQAAMDSTPEVKALASAEFARLGYTPRF